MKKLMASLLVFTIGVGANGLYCNAETEPTEKVDAKVTQTSVDGYTEKTKSAQNDAKKVSASKEASEKNKEGVLPPELVEKILIREKHKKRMKDSLKAAYLRFVHTFIGPMMVLFNLIDAFAHLVKMMLV